MTLFALGLTACAQDEQASGRITIGDEDVFWRTFEQGVQQASDVFVATLDEVVDLSPFRAREQSLLEYHVRIDRVIKGSQVLKEKVSLLQREMPGSLARLRPDEVGSQFLVVAHVVRDLRSDDSTRIYPTVLAMVAGNSYKRVKLPTGTDFGIRLFSPLASQLGGYDGSRDSIASRLVLGQRLRLVDALEWSDLLLRAAQPATEQSQQLGADEIAYISAEPAIPAPEAAGS